MSGYLGRAWNRAAGAKCRIYRVDESGNEIPRETYVSPVPRETFIGEAPKDVLELVKNAMCIWWKNEFLKEELGTT